MKKNLIFLCSAVVALALLTAGWLLLQEQPEPEPEEVSYADDLVQVFLIDSPIRQLTVHYGGESFTIRNLAPNAIAARNNPSYTVKELEGLPQQDILVETVAETASALAAKKLLSPAETDLSKYGLEHPRATVDFFYMDDTAHTLRIGDTAPNNEGVYICMEETRDVYLAEAGALTGYLRLPGDYLSKTVTAGGSGTFKDCERLTISGGGREQPLVIERDPSASPEETQNTHRIVSPVNAAIDSRALLTYLNPVFSLTATGGIELYPDEEAIARCGLDEPYVTVTAEGSADGDFTLHISQPQPDASVYLMKEGVPVIYTAQAPNWLEVPYYELIDRRVLQPEIDTVATILVEAGDAAYTFTLSGSGDALAVTAGGAALDAENFLRYYSTLTAATYQEHTDEPLPEGAEPLARVTFTYRDGHSDMVEYYPGPVRRCRVAVNGHSEFLTGSAYVDRVIQDAAKAAAGETVRVYA